MSGCDIVEEPGACVCCGTGLRDAEKDEEGMTTVANFADNMADVMQKIFI